MRSCDGTVHPASLRFDSNSLDQKSSAFAQLQTELEVKSDQLQQCLNELDSVREAEEQAKVEYAAQIKLLHGMPFSLSRRRIRHTNISHVPPFRCQNHLPR